jgi:uncharacterized MAPEG superfamily protein
MTAELSALAAAGLLHAGHLCLIAVRANLEIGPAYFLTPRDGPPPRPLSQPTARLKRAFENHNEALLLFVVAVVLLTFLKVSTPFTAVCAWVYVGARVLYVPAYVFGWAPWRSLIWAAGFVATLLMLLAALI